MEANKVVLFVVRYGKKIISCHSHVGREAHQGQCQETQKAFLAFVMFTYVGGVNTLKRFFILIEFFCLVMLMYLNEIL